MKSINNKIKKPIISIGYDKIGKLSVNVDLNKTKKLDFKETSNLISILDNIIDVIKHHSYNKDSKTKQRLAVIIEFCKKFNINFPHEVKLDDLINIEVCISNNMKLRAIKIFKEVAGCGLKDGKDFIEFYSKKLKHK